MKLNFLSLVLNAFTPTTNAIKDIMPMDKSKTLLMLSMPKFKKYGVKDKAAWATVIAAARKNANLLLKKLRGRFRAITEINGAKINALTTISPCLPVGRLKQNALKILLPEQCPPESRSDISRNYRNKAFLSHA
jgi:hypothetical protein